MFNNFFNQDKLPRRARKSLAPGKDFNTRAKARFLAEFDVHYKTLPSKGFTRFAKVALAFMLLFILTAGASTFADTQNVPADSVLYPLKRASESVRLAITPTADVPQLEATFAARREDEITDLQDRNPTSTLIGGLDNDLESDVSSSISAAQEDKFHDGTLSSFCARLSTIIGTSSVDMHLQLLSHPKMLQRFESQCEDPTSTITATTTISTSTSHKGPHRALQLDL